MAAKQPHFSPKQVADSLQVSESSVKRWCDGGVIPVIRTVGGHRRITLEGLQKFLRESNRCNLVRPEALGCAVSIRDRDAPIPGNEQPQQKQFREALAVGNESLCREILQERLASGWTRADAAEDLIKDAMIGLGEAWECNRLDIYQERRACAICFRLINELQLQLPDLPSDAPMAIGGTPAGDPYQLPTALVELALREVGWRAVNLGNNLPMESFIQAAHDHDPQLCWLSISAIDNLDLFVAAENNFASTLDDDVTLIVGGRALNDRIRPRLRYTAHCDSIKHLVEFASMLRMKLGL